MVDFKSVKYNDKKITAIAENLMEEGKLFEVEIDIKTGAVKTIPVIDEDNVYEMQIKQVSWNILLNFEERGSLKDHEFVAWG